MRPTSILLLITSLITSWCPFGTMFCVSTAMECTDRVCVFVEEEEERSCSSGGCCMSTSACEEEEEEDPDAPKERIPCCPLMACSACCIGIPSGTLQMQDPHRPLLMVTVPTVPMLETGFASVVWRPPDVLVS